MPYLYSYSPFEMLPKFKSSLLHKCPRCLKGDMFPDRNPYHLRNTARMHSHCPVCGLNYEPEPGYFYGAMYVSYAFTVAISVAVFLLYYVLMPQQGVLAFLVLLSIVLALLSPYTFRTSRAIWLNFFVRYQPSQRHESSDSQNQAGSLK